MATHISNLTDARYFAARMVDFLVFHPDLSKVDSIPIIKEIQGWIDGVTWALEITESSEALHFIARESDITTGMAKSQELLTNFSTQFVREDHEVKGIDGLWLRVEDKLPPKDILLNYEGLVFRGGSEEKIGLKSYDHLDAIWDQLEELSL